MNPAPRPAQPLLAGTAPDARDRALAARVGAGDERAFEDLFARYRDPLQRYCWSITGSAEDAEEALQTTMLKAHRALSHGTIPIALRPWLYRIARNTCLNVVRDRPPWTSLAADTPDPGAEPEAVSESRDRMRRLREDLGSLGERPRTALLLRELGGMSHREIADQLGEGATSGTAKHLIREAREALHDMDLGRDLPCADVRRTVSDGDGRVIRSRRLRSHLSTCAACAGFQGAIGRRQTDLAAMAGVPVLAVGHILGSATSSGVAVTASGGAAGVSAPSVTGLSVFAGIGGIGAKVAALASVAVIGGGAVTLPAISSDAPSAPAAPVARAHATTVPAPPGTSATPPPRPASPAAAPPVRATPPAAVTGATGVPAVVTAPVSHPTPTTVAAPPIAAAVPAVVADGPATPAPPTAPRVVRPRPAAPGGEGRPGRTPPAARTDGGPPDHAGRPAGAGPPAHAGPPAGAGPPAHSGRPAGVGPPANPGPPEHAGPPANAGRPADAGPPANAGPPADAAPPANAGSSSSPSSSPPSAQAPGPPAQAGPPSGSGAPTAAAGSGPPAGRGGRG